MKNTAKMLGLPDDASESQINAAIEALQKDVALLALVKAENADNAVELAMATGRITAGQKDIERKAVIDSPINASQGLRLRSVMGALPAPTTGEKKADNAGAPPTTGNAWATHEAMTDAQLAQWYAGAKTNPQAVAYLAANNKPLFARAERVFQVAQ